MNYETLGELLRRYHMICGNLKHLLDDKESADERMRGLKSRIAKERADHVESKKAVDEFIKNNKTTKETK